MFEKKAVFSSAFFSAISALIRSSSAFAFIRSAASFVFLLVTMATNAKSSSSTSRIIMAPKIIIANGGIRAMNVRLVFLGTVLFALMPLIAYETELIPLFRIDTSILLRLDATAHKSRLVAESGVTTYEEEFI